MARLSQHVLFAFAVVILTVSAASIAEDGKDGRQLFMKPQADGRIIGGLPATIEDFPYQLSLRYRRGHICGAAIVSETYAITAAHCMRSTNPADFVLRSGSTSLYRGGREHPAATITVHPNYDLYKQDYDLAIIQVKVPFEFSDRVAPIPLVRSGAPPTPGTMAWVTGWGVTMEGSFLPMMALQQVSVPVVPSEECSKSYIGYGVITNRMLCAGYKAGQKDACQGDSGGPLVADGNLVGVVSWGAGCARPALPGVYTNLAEPGLRAWVAQVAGGI